MNIKENSNNICNISMNNNYNDNINNENLLYASIIGLRQDLHPNINKVKVVLSRLFNCNTSIIKTQEYYGVQLYFNSQEALDIFMMKKTHSFKLDDQSIRLQKKHNKQGNRFYVNYNQYHK
jgi:hypothetical protein